MKKIPLTQNKYALIDDEDYAIVSLFKWCASKIHNKIYAVTEIKVNDKKLTLYMHRLIVNAPRGIVTDHRVGVGLDNRKENLRLCTNQQNIMNSQPIVRTSKYKGVCWDKTNKKWMSQIMLNGRNKTIGRFYEEKAAAQAYDIMARKLHGEFAYFNNIGIIAKSSVELRRSKWV